MNLHRKMAYRRPSTALSAAGLNINDLRSLIKLDIVASNELEAKIDLFRQDARTGKNPPAEKLDQMELTNKDMTKDVVRNIEKIESQGHPSKLTTTDREVLQALHARLATCDQQAMRLAELRDMLSEVQRKQQKEAPLPLGGKPRTPDNSPSPRKVTESLRGVPDVGVRERTESRELPGPPSPQRGSDATYGKNFTSTPSPRFDEPVSQSFPRRSSRVYAANDFAGVQSPRRSNDSFFSKAPAPAFPPPPRRSVSIKQAHDYPLPPSPRMPPSPRRSSGSVTGTPSPKRSPRIDTPQSGEQLKYEDFYHVNCVNEGPAEPDKTAWPILYRILDVDPATDPRVYDLAMKR